MKAKKNNFYLIEEDRGEFEREIERIKNLESIKFKQNRNAANNTPTNSLTDKESENFDDSISEMIRLASIADCKNEH
ncbi:MAG: hypothetical protein LBD94_03090 [Rickettsiales bacterium]|jgi:hypothetical protein|nr:hypothetical protein [Rickettsiales bacterium]